MNDEAKHSAINGELEALSPIPLIVVPHRESKLGQRLWPAIALLAVGLAVIGYRASVADWQGLSYRASKLKTKAGAEQSTEAGKTPSRSELALAPSAAAPVSKTPAPKLATAQDPKPTPKVDPWKEIEREAEKKRAERAELDKIKEDEAEKALTQPLRPIPPPPNRGRAVAQLNAQQREMLQRFETMRREQLAAHQRMFNQFRQTRGFNGPPQFQQLLRQQERMMEDMRRLAAGPGWGGFGDPPQADFPILGPNNRPGVQTERRRIQTPNGVIIIEKQWFGDPNPDGE